MKDKMLEKIILLILSSAISLSVSLVVFFSIIKTSLGVTGSLIAVVLAYLGFAVLGKIFSIEEDNRFNINLVQTSASAAGSIAASSLFILAYYINGNSFTAFQLFFFLFISGCLGVILSIPFRIILLLKKSYHFHQGLLVIT